MGLDWALLERAAQGGPPVLRLYGWEPPCLSLGRFQEAADLPVRARALGLEAVRRPTGGRAVLHHQEVTYSVILPPALVADAGIRTSYAVLSGALNAALAPLADAQRSTPNAQCSPREAHRATPNCFALASECDTLVAGRKLIGSAQVRHAGALLQHGSLLLAVDRPLWAALFGEVGAPVTLGELTGERDLAELRQRGAAAIRAVPAGLGGEWEPVPPTPEDVRAANAATPRFGL